MNQVQPKIDIGEMTIAPDRFCVIAGPCSVESKESFGSIAKDVRESGAHALRGGIFKMRTSPDSFQGLGREAFEFVKETKLNHAMPFISEVVDPRHIADMYDLVDMFQVGSRNMYNYSLLKELSKVDKPVLLKRGFSATIDEWIHAANYVVKGGNDRVVLCERGIRSFESKTRNTLDLNAVAWVKANTSFPVIVDPSHGVGVRDLIPKLALASAAVGADGIIVEVHNSPEHALSDGFQALLPEDFSKMMKLLGPVAQLVGRSL